MVNYMVQNAIDGKYVRPLTIIIIHVEAAG